MRRALDALYAAGAGLAALALVGIFVVMTLQVVLRQFEVQFAGSDDLSAYLCVAAAFFALAATFRRGELIRVSMGIANLPAWLRPWAEGLALTMAALATGYITFWTAQDVLFSLEIEEVAQGTVPFLLWVPKLAMPLGSGLLLVAILDEFVTLLRGQPPAYLVAAAERAASGDFSTEG